jgi:hypothetical protein
MAISIITSEFHGECDGNMFADNYDKYHCKNCYNGIQNFSHFSGQTDIFLDPINLIKFLRKINHKEGAFTSALCELIKNYKCCKSDADQVLNDTDQETFNQPIISARKEALRSQLTSIASKLLNSEHTKLEDLSVEEQKLWNWFDNSDIYEFITGEPDTLSEFQFDWIEPCQLAVHFPPGSFQPQDLQPSPNQDKQQVPQFQPNALIILPAQPPVPPVQPPQNLPQVILPQPPVQPVQPAQPPAQSVTIVPPVLPHPEPIAGPSSLQPPVHHHYLRPHPDLNYKETGIKQ